MIDNSNKILYNPWFYIGIAAFILFGIVTIWHLPYCFVSWSDLLDKVDQGKIKDVKIAYEKYHENVSNHRETIVQFFSAIIVITGLFVAYKRARAMEDDAKAANDQVEATKQTNVVDQFYKAIDQLGRDERPQIRIAAIYSLGKVMKMDDEYHNIIIEYLCTRFRDKNKFSEEGFDFDHEKYKQDVDPELQTIIAILGRRDVKPNEPPIDLHGTNLYKYNFNHLYDFDKSKKPNFDNIILSSSFLKNTKFNGVQMNNAVMFSTIISSPEFVNADLMDSKFGNSRIKGINVSDAILDNSDFRGIHFYKDGDYQIDNFKSDVHNAKSIVGIKSDYNELNLKKII